MDSIAFSKMVCFSTELPMAAYPGADQYKVLVLESDPVPGYFTEGGFPENENMRHLHDHHLYLVIKNPVSCMQDKIIRHASLIKKKHKLLLHASPGQITLFNDVYPCIRIRTSELSHLDVFIEEFQKIGIKFSHPKKVKPYISFIQYKKYIDFVQLADGVYQDAYEKNRYFVTIPKDIEFADFKKMMSDAKNNCDFNMFDASLVYYHEKDGTHDMVSLYSEHCDTSRLPEMKEYLEKEIKILFG